jgi:hypothetical protein
MPEDQDNQIERREPGGISRRSETARRGSDAARFVRGLANRRTESSIERRISFQYLASFGSFGRDNGQFSSQGLLLAATNTEIHIGDPGNHRIQTFDKQGNFLRMWGGGGTTTNQLRAIVDLRSGPPSWGRRENLCARQR